MSFTGLLSCTACLCHVDQESGFQHGYTFVKVCGVDMYGFDTILCLPSNMSLDHYTLE